MPALATVTIQNHNGVAKDAVKYSWAFDDDATSPTIQANILSWTGDLLATTTGAMTQPLVNYLSDCLDMGSTELAIYDLTGHLDGSPHGSPVYTHANPISDSPFVGISNQVAAVFTAVSAAYATTPSVGPTGAIPTPEWAQDMGAPATHPGATRPKSRQSSRIYFGPLSGEASSNDTHHNAFVSAGLSGDAAIMLGTLKPGGVNSLGLHWSNWSRRDAALTHVAAGWVDHRLATRRSREFVPNARTAF